ncbi:MAG TPA: hypothetical protein VJ599_00420 [Nitrososphaeraceae archaeon]|nr:hypothetical protein [Nitrososphaeraceae archaeon]
MTSNIGEITFIAEQYFFFKNPHSNQIETRLVKRKQYEKQARNVIKKFSKYDLHSITNYQAERNELTEWINLAITECSRIEKQKQNHHGNKKLNTI